MKKIFLLFYICFIPLLFCSCEVFSDIKPIKTPEECVSAYFDLIVENKYDSAYKNYLSDTSKSVKKKEQFISEFNDGSKTKSYTIDSTKQLDNPNYTVFAVNGKITKINSNGSEQIDDYTKYIIKQPDNGLLRILDDGVISVRTYKMHSTHDSNLIHAENLVVYEKIGQIECRMTFKNTDSKHYVIGNGSGYKIQINAGSKVFTCDINNQVVMNPNEQITINGFFDNAEGKITNIKISNVYEASEKGKILNESLGQTYSVNIV